MLGTIILISSAPTMGAVSPALNSVFPAQALRGRGITRASRGVFAPPVFGGGQGGGSCWVCDCHIGVGKSVDWANGAASHRHG